MSKKRKEKSQVQKAGEAKNTKTKETLDTEKREKNPLVDMKMELKSENWQKALFPNFYLVFQTPVETIPQNTYNVSYTTDLW